MTRKAQRIRVGIFTLAAALLVTLALVTFAGMRFWEGDDRYRIVFHGSVMGLEKGARVLLNGMRVGSVAKVEVSPADLRDVVVTIAVREDTPIHADTNALLQHAGITGLKVIDLRGGTNEAPRMPPGSTITAGETLLDRLQEHAETLASQSAELMTRANNLVAKLEGVDEIVVNLADASRSLQRMIAENRAGLRASVAAVEKSANTASVLMEGRISQLVGSADALVQTVQGVVHRNDAALRTAVFDLRQASRAFKELAREVRQRPSRLLFSKPAPERKLP